MEPGELLYDGTCGFCTRSRDWIMHRIRDDSIATAAQDVSPERRATLGLSDDDLATAVYWIDASGAAYRGARGLGHALRHTRQPWRSVGLILGTAAGAVVATPFYRLVARYRHRLPGGKARCSTEHC